MFGEQTVTFFRRGVDNTWQRHELDASRLKDEQAFVELAGISGSSSDLAALEQQERQQ